MRSRKVTAEEAQAPPPERPETEPAHRNRATKPPAHNSVATGNALAAAKPSPHFPSSLAAPTISSVSIALKTAGRSLIPTARVRSLKSANQL